MVVVYLPGGSDVRMDDVVQVFMDSIQQPEQELLRVMLGVSLELQGALGHHILQQEKTHTVVQADLFCS